MDTHREMFSSACDWHLAIRVFGPVCPCPYVRTRRLTSPKIPTPSPTSTQSICTISPNSLGRTVLSQAGEISLTVDGIIGGSMWSKEEARCSLGLPLLHAIVQDSLALARRSLTGQLRPRIFFPTLGRLCQVLPLLRMYLVSRRR